MSISVRFMLLRMGGVDRLVNAAVTDVNGKFGNRPGSCTLVSCAYRHMYGRPPMSLTPIMNGSALHSEEISSLVVRT